MGRVLKRRLDQIETALIGSKRRQFFVWIDSDDDAEAKIQQAMTENRCSREQVITVGWQFGDFSANDDIGIVVHAR